MKRKRRPNIEFADATATEALEPYVKEVFKALCTKNVLFSSDESMVCNFLVSRVTGETERDDPFRPGKKRRVLLVTTDGIPENDERLKKASETLGFPVTKDDYIYELAIRLRDK